MALDETRVESAGILGMKQCFLQFCLCSEKDFTVDPDHPILPALLDDLAVDADAREQPFRCPLVHLEPVAAEEETVFDPASLQGLANHSLDVPEVTPSDLEGDQSLDHTSKLVSTQLTRFFAPMNVLISSV